MLYSFLFHSYCKLYCKKIKPVNLKGNQFWIVIERIDVEAETPLLWHADAKNWLTGKDPDSGKDWRWEKKGTIKDEMVGWHHQFNGNEFEHSPGAGDGQGGLACWGSWGRKESDTTELLNWTDGNLFSVFSRNSSTIPISICKKSQELTVNECFHSICHLCGGRTNLPDHSVIPCPQTMSKKQAIYSSSLALFFTDYQVNQMSHFSNFSE